jgi:hypothetical protein
MAKQSEAKYSSENYFDTLYILKVVHVSRDDDFRPGSSARFRQCL